MMDPFAERRRSARRERARGGHVGRVLLEAPHLVDEPDPLYDPRGRADRCPSCDQRRHGRCDGGACRCPSPRCHPASVSLERNRAAILAMIRRRLAS